MRRISVALAALVAAAGLAAVHPDLAAAQDNAAVAVNTKDSSSVFRLAFSINRVARDVVDSTNAAVAVASCTECKTVALAIQVVLITGDASVVTPTNVALAFNIECTACETLASAYQYVFDTDGAQVHFTPTGNQRLAEIRHELRQLRHSDLGVVEIQSRVDALMNELSVVLRDELVVAGRPEPTTVATTPSAPQEETTPTTDPSTAPTDTATEPAPTETTESVPTDTTQTTEPTETQETAPTETSPLVP